MNYAQRSDKAFSTSKPVTTKRVVSPEAKARRDYIAAHTFSVNVNPSTKQGSVKIESKYGE